MPKSIQKSPVSNAVFYKPVGAVKEMGTGYLMKSPPPRLLKNVTSWKRRFFVLFEMEDKSFLFNYYKSSEEREKPKGGIELDSISLLYLSPQKHIHWPWISKNFKCSADSVLFIRAHEREYFLIGENSSDIDDWFWGIYNALITHPHQLLNPEILADNCTFPIESISDPVLRVFTIKKRAKFLKESQMTQIVKKNRCASVPNQASQMTMEQVSQQGKRRSEPVRNPLDLHYDYPRSVIRKASLGNEDFTSDSVAVEKTQRRLSEPENKYYNYPKKFIKQTSEKSEDEEVCEEDENGYMKMGTVFETMKEEEGNNNSKVDGQVERYTTGSLVKSVTQVFDKLKTHMSTEDEAGPDERENCQAERDTNPAENKTLPPVLVTQAKPLEQHSSIESNEEELVAEKDILVNQVDLKQHLIVSDVEGKPCNEEELVAEKDILVNQVDLKQHLIVSDVEGKPCVSGWTGQSQTSCPFHRGDKILAINDLHTGSVEEFQTYLRKIVKNQVTLTILRVPGSEPMSSPCIPSM